MSRDKLFNYLLTAFPPLFGLATRFVSVLLIIQAIVVTVVAHWPDQWTTLNELLMGYAITDVGFGKIQVHR